jgi:Kef-type K+ transport system membrane component KefB
MSYVADLVGLSSVIGAFFAVIVGPNKVKERVFINVESIGYAIFIPVFFVNIGLEVEWLA